MAVNGLNGLWGAIRSAATAMRIGMARLAIAVAALVVTLPASDAPAQMGMMMGGGGGGDGAISKRSATLYGKILGFDKDQIETLGTLHEGYLAEHRRITEEMQGYMKKIQEEVEETKDWTLYQKQVPKKMQEFTKRMEESQKVFLDDVKGLCTPEQEAGWDVLERHRRREMFLRFNFIAGSGVDLVDVARRTGMSPEEGKMPAEVREAMDAYELAMDRKLAEVEREMREQETKMMEMAANMDFAKMQEAMKKFSDQAVQVRNLNRENARRVSAAVPEEFREKFDQEVLRRTYPRVYRKPHVVRSFDAAEKFSDIKEDQKAAIKDLRELYARESQPLNEKWSAAITEREDKEGASFLSMMNWRQQEKDNPVTMSRRARQDLDKEYSKKLAEILTEDQKSRLPKEDVKPQTAGPGADMMEDFDLGESDEEGEER
jgi:hypothetical protein